MRLSEYLCAASGRKFEWGRCDCVTFVCDWIVAQRGVDPAASFRGQYRSGLKAAENLADNGGIVEAVGKFFSSAGLAATKTPKPGDVGVVAMMRPTCAIYVGDGKWASKGRRGITVSVASPLAAWSV